MNDVKMVTGGLKFHSESLICANLVYQIYVIQKLKNVTLHTHTHAHAHAHTKQVCVCT
jgi:hypothetical protein